MHKYLEEAFALKEKTIENRRYLHSNPECGMVLPDTKEFVTKKLEELSLKPHFLGESGVLVSIKGNQKGKTILLRCDMDALPMEELNDLPFKSPFKDRAHTCGHDMHTAIMLSVVEVLNNHKDDIKGCVRVVFEPGEEVLGGATMLINEGALDKTFDDTEPVSVAMAAHVNVERYPGEISYCIGGANSSVNPFKLTLTGVSAHSSTPHLGIDPIAAGVHVYQACQELIAREIPSEEKMILTFGQFNAGTMSNTIPKEAVLQGSLRGFNNELCEKMDRRMKEILEGVEKMFNVKATFENLFPPVPAVYNDPNLTKEMIKYVEELGVNAYKIDGIPGSEDFAFISAKVPSFFINLGAKVKGNEYSNHNPKVLFNEDCIPYGIASFVNCAINYLNEN